MKFMKFPLLCLLLLLLLSGYTDAQIVCGPAQSSLDSFRIGAGERARPGDTVNIPVLIKNIHDVQSIELYFEYDTRVLSPIYYYTEVSIFGDSVDVYRNQLTGARMNILTDPQGGEFLFVSEYIGAESLDPNMERLKVYISPFNLIDSGVVTVVIDSGDGTAFYIPFVVNDTAAHNTVANFPIVDIAIKSPVFPFPTIGCAYSRYADTSGILDVRPTALLGTFTVDTAAVDPPIINSFTANPTNIQAGSSSTLSWNVENADSVVINNGIGMFTALVSSVSVAPTVTTTYTITAFNAGTARPSLAVNITVGVPPNGNAPTIATIAGSPFTVSQGVTVSFSVTASDINPSDIITLSAISLPPNANFSQVVGSGSVTGNFSFTPDFTQSGTFSAVFQASDNTGLSSFPRTVIINVLEIQNDRLFSTSAIGQQPVGGLSGKRNIFFPINMVTAEEVYGVQFDFLYDPVFFEVDSFIVTGRSENYVVYDNIGQTPGEIKVVTFGLNNEPLVNIVDTTAILYAVISIDSNATPGDYPIYFENGWESVNPDPDFPSLELVTDSGVIQVDNPGDVNLDKRIDVADLVNIVASIINNFTLSERQFDVADVITNDTVNVFDLVGIVNLVFGVPLNPNPAPLLEDERATINLAYSNIITGGNDMIVVNSETPVDLAAVEIDIEYDPASVVLGKPSLAADAEGMTLRYNDNKSGKIKVLVHFTNPYGGSRIKTGFANMIEIPIIAKEDIISGNREQIKIVQANFSTDVAARVEVDGVDRPGLPSSFSLSQNYPNPFNPTTKIDFSIESNKFVNLEIYNILGQQVKSLIDESMPAGAHSVEWDATNQQGSKVASGVYLYRLTVDNNTQSKKMLLLK